MEQNVIIVVVKAKITKIPSLNRALSISLCKAQQNRTTIDIIGITWKLDQGREAIVPLVKSICGLTLPGVDNLKFILT